MAYDLAQAKMVLTDKEIGLVLIGVGLNESEGTELHEYVKKVNPSLPIIKHYGGGSGLLFAEIYQGLQQ